MISYFAYGSNMLRERLQARVGPVAVIGVARALGFEHSFTKLGRDGSGKGNISPVERGVVHGVVYRLDVKQLETLRTYEGGYEQFSLTVEIATLDDTMAARAQWSPLEVESFRAIRPVAPLAPTRQYVVLYERGMREHDLPEGYQRSVVEQARMLWEKG